MPAPLLRPLGFGEILDGAFALYRRHFRDLFLTALVPFLPLLLLSAVMLAVVVMAPSDAASLAVTLFTLVALAYNLIALTLVWTALAHLFSRAMLSGGVGWKEALRAGTSHLLAAWGAGILAFVLLSAVTTVGVFITVALTLALGLIFSGPSILAGAAAPVLVLLAFIPAALIGAGLMIFLPAIVTEGAGPISALRRSWDLMTGARWKGLGLFWVGWLIVLVPTLVLIGFFTLFFGVGVTLGIDGSEGSRAISQMLSQLAQPLVGAVTTPFTVALVVLLYFDRRVRREGLDLELAHAELDDDDPADPGAEWPE